MALYADNFNFVASDDIGNHCAITFDVPNCTRQKLTVRAADGDDDTIIGFTTAPAEAGETVRYVRLEIGQIFSAETAGAVTAGAQLTITTDGKVTAGTTKTFPIFAIDAATAAQKIRVGCAALAVTEEEEP